MMFARPVILYRSPEGIGNLNYQGPVTGSGTPTPGPTGINSVITFAVGDGQAGSPADGDASLIAAMLQGQSLVNVQLLVIREGIGVNWNSAVQVNDIRRYNHLGQGGFTWENGVTFQAGERFMIYILSLNFTDEV